jgi:predicted nicotinamide N-methyase
VISGALLIVKFNTHPKENHGMPQSELDQIMERIRAKFDVETVPLRIGGKELKILQLTDFESYVEGLIEKGVEVKELPYWAKVWDACFLLALFLGKQPVVPGQRILEIGAGLGVVGIYAALCGHKVTLSDVDEDALLFARANVLMNGIPHVEALNLDWRDSNIPEPYDIIVGSEVIYERTVYPALVQFLRKALAPKGTIFLSKNTLLPTPTFFPELTTYFKFKQTVGKVHLDGEAQEIAIYAIRRKEEGN